MSFKSLPGFRDFYPGDCALREAIFESWRKAARGFGFSQYDGPPLEPTELYQKKSGDEILGQLYHFEDKGERQVSLRPELTPTLARMAGARQRDYKKPLKWFSIPQVFRYERAQRGRLREHFQWNCDILGEPGLGAEAELIAVLLEGLRGVGLGSDDVVVRLSDREFWMDFLKKHEVDVERHYEFFQALDKMEREKPEVTEAKLGDLYPKVREVFESGESSVRLEELTGLLGAMGLGDYVKVDLTIVRGLAYYTGVVFEVHDRKGEFRAIAGGGRYDGLVKLVSGVDMPALGFGMGDVVLGEMLKDRGFQPEAPGKVDVYLVIPDEAYRGDALGMAMKLRAQGRKVDYPLTAMKMGKQFQAAEERGARHALVVDEGVRSGKCQLKDLSNRSQEEISFTEKDGELVFSVRF